MYLKGPQRQQKAAEVDDRRIIFVVKKKNFIAFYWVKNTLEEAGIWFVDFDRNPQVSLSVLQKKKGLCTNEMKFNLYQNDERNRSWFKVYCITYQTW